MTYIQKISTRKQLEEEAANDPQKPFWLMTLNYGESIARARQKWCDETLKVLEGRRQRTKRNRWGDIMHDPLWMRTFLAIHITAGSGAFVLAPLALVTAKGGKAHRLWGKIYFWCMTVVAVTAMVMAVYRPILFLALVAVFSFYSAFIAYRVLGQKAAWKGESVAKPLDWLAAVICLIASAVLALLGAVRPGLVENLAIPAIVFGAIGTWLAGSTMWSFTHPPRTKMFWWYAHLQGMVGSYIAAWTAFCVVTIGPRVHGAWWLWVLPTAIGVPAMIATTAYYKHKFAPRLKPAVS